MNDFTASNGIHLHMTPGQIADAYLLGTIPDEQGPVGFIPELHATASQKGMEALREFFQMEADERYGKWRSKLHPDCFAVWAYVGETIHICSDKYPAAGSAKWTFDRESCLDGDTIEHEVAREFFDAHPEPKPWHDAKPGEVWDVDMPDGGMRAVTFYAGGQDIPQVVFRDAFTQDVVTVESEDIRDARRIYPEPAV